MWIKISLRTFKTWKYFVKNCFFHSAILSVKKRGHPFLPDKYKKGGFQLWTYHQHRHHNPRTWLSESVNTDKMVSIAHHRFCIKTPNCHTWSRRKQMAEFECRQHRQPPIPLHIEMPDLPSVEMWAHHVHSATHAELHWGLRSILVTHKLRAVAICGQTALAKTSRSVFPIACDVSIGAINHLRHNSASKGRHTERTFHFRHLEQFGAIWPASAHRLPNQIFSTSYVTDTFCVGEGIGKLVKYCKRPRARK
jgi:hypothetical protein